MADDRRGRGRPQKSLLELVRHGDFRSRRPLHAALLDRSEPLPWKSLSKLQDQYRGSKNEFERKRIAREFEHEIPLVHERIARSRKPLSQVLDSLGPPKSADRVVNFFPRFFRHYAGPRAGRPFRLEPFQEEFVREFWRRRKDGSRVYRFGLLGVPKGNGKTPLAAVLGTNALMDPPTGDIPEVYGIAGARDQAAFAQKFVARAIEKGDLGNYLRKSGSVVHCAETEGEYSLLSAEGFNAHGINPSAGLVDEWWQFKHRHQREGFNAIEDALHKRGGESWLLAISQAYFDYESMLAEAHQAALKHPRLQVKRDGCLLVLEDEEAGFLMHWYGLPDEEAANNDRLLRLANPLSTLSVRDIRAPLLRPGADLSDWLRLHGNLPTRGKTSWLPAGAWAGLLADHAQVPVGAEIYVGVDAAYSGDTTAVVYAWRDGNGRIHLRAKVWSAIATNLAHEYPEGSTLDNEELVEPYVHELARKFKIRAIVFDPEYFTTEAKHLSRAGFRIAPMYPQSGDMADAVRSFKRMVGEGRLAHDGDAVLANHVGNAVARKTSRGTKVYDAIEKPGEAFRIDSATAGVMAAWLCVSDPEVAPFAFVSGEAKKPIPLESPTRAHADKPAPWRPQKKRR